MDPQDSQQEVRALPEDRKRQVADGLNGYLDPVRYLRYMSDSISASLRYLSDDSGVHS